MSRYEWEAGTLTLPSAAVPTVKAALRSAALEFRAEIENEVRACRNAFTSRSATKWAAHKDAWIDKLCDRGQNRWHTTRTMSDDSISLIDQLLRRLDTVRNPTAADFDAVLGAKPTSRTTRFTADEATVTIAGRTLHWSTGDNNHAVAHARNSWLGLALFKALGAVTWTRGTGGALVGNDEYNQEASGAGEASNYVTATYGPPRARTARAATAYR